ncbi:chromosome partitioning protein [Belnapia rosea]|nr:chromosome partitioning protein [Belnapia rosea]
MECEKTQHKDTPSGGRILLVTKLKGGSGATTTCRELAAAAVAHGLDVALIDLDGQGGLTRWWSRRTRDAEGQRSRPTLLEIPIERLPTAAGGLRRRYGLTVIDSPPSVHAAIRAVAVVSDLALVPSRPTVDDLDAVGPVARLLRGACDQGFILTQVPGGKRSRDGAEALQRLAALAPVFGSTSARLDYSRPAAKGRTGYEFGTMAHHEIAALWRTVAERLGIASLPDDAKPSLEPVVARETRHGAA